MHRIFTGRPPLGFPLTDRPHARAVSCRIHAAAFLSDSRAPGLFESLHPAKHAGGRRLRNSILTSRPALLTGLPGRRGGTSLRNLIGSP